MGTAVCCGARGYISKNLHIYQINRYYSDFDTSLISESRNESEALVGSLKRDSNITTNANSEEVGENSKKNNNLENGLLTKKQTLKNQKGEFQLLSYDIEEERFMKFKIIFPIIKSIEGLNELCIKSKFYLCGVSPKQKNEGSFLFEINLGDKIENNELNAQILINSQYPHVYPSLISDKLGQIICIGGKGQTKCELYNFNLNKWYVLPQLPEERYKCTLCIDPKETYLYLFGGLTTTKKKNNNDDNENNNPDNHYKILKMHLVKQFVWEKIKIKNNSKSLIFNRYLAGAFVFNNDEDFIFIIGGEDSNNDCLNDIIRFSIKKSEFESTGTKLDNNAKFIHQYGILNEQCYYFIDSLNQIHKINRHDCLPMDYNPEIVE